jgi:hypothetical protein
VSLFLPISFLSFKLQFFKTFVNLKKTKISQKVLVAKAYGNNKGQGTFEGFLIGT